MAHQVRYLGDPRDNEAHVEDVGNLYVALCGVAMWESDRLDEPNGRTLCKLCGEISYDEFYDQERVREFFPSNVGGSW